MVTPPKTLDQAAKVIVAYLDGRRLKGYAYNFSPLKDSFDLLPQKDPLQHRGTKVEMKDVKAVFFVKDFVGNPEYRQSPLVEERGYGRKIEVTFSDGEKVVGVTQGYNPQKLGFFMIPIDPKSNNVRIFVVNRNTRQIKPI
jgi:hypothetical protein